MDLEKLFDIMGIKKDDFKDLHITRFFSSFVAVSEGKVIGVTEPFLEYCPLACALYKRIKSAGKSCSELKKAIKKAIEEKISKFGFFTDKRELHRENIAIPYGASEIMMYALRKKRIDSAVVVCDGAGTVITNRPEIVQGIGARMNGLFYTSPIRRIIEKLGENSCLSEKADIDQIGGLEKAARLGYRKIAVTINGYSEEKLARIKEIENKYNVSATSLLVCNTGAGEKRIEEIKEYADLVWSCASKHIREIVGKKAILQISTKIPVFVLTKKGLDLVSAYSSNESVIENLNLEKQYIISGRYGGQRIKMGNFFTCLSETGLPVRSEEEPVPLT